MRRRLVTDIGAGLEIEVIGISQHCLGTQTAYHLGGQCLDVCLGADGDERGGANITVRGMNDAGSSEAAVRVQTCADRKSTVRAVTARRGRGLERRELLGSGGGEPVVGHRSKTSSFFSPSVRRIAAITG